MASFVQKAINNYTFSLFFQTMNNSNNNNVNAGEYDFLWCHNLVSMLYFAFFTKLCLKCSEALNIIY